MPVSAAIGTNEAARQSMADMGERWSEKAGIRDHAEGMLDVVFSTFSCNSRDDVST